MHLISRWQNLTRWWLATTFKIIGKHHFYFKVSGVAMEYHVHPLSHNVVSSTPRHVWDSNSHHFDISYFKNIYYMTSDNVFSDWLTSVVTFFNKTLYSTCKKSRKVNMIFHSYSRHLKIEMVCYTNDDFRWGEYKGWSILVFTEIESH
jgi:hypothetical protein